MKRNSKKGFTLAELLIVVAIIAILVAIMMPVFGAQLSKARLAADLANVRSTYSELVANSMLGDSATISGNTIGEVKVSLAKLQAAVTYNSKVEFYKDGSKVTASSTAAEIDEVVVTYGDSEYSGSFKVDSDVKGVS